MAELQIPSEIAVAELNGEIPFGTILGILACTMGMSSEMSGEPEALETAQRFIATGQLVSFDGVILYSDEKNDVSDNPVPFESYISSKLIEAFPNKPHPSPQQCTDIALAMGVDYGNEQMIDDCITVMKEQDGRKPIGIPSSYLKGMLARDRGAITSQAENIRQSGRSNQSILREAMRAAEVAVREAPLPQTTTDTLDKLTALRGKLRGES